MPLPLAIAEAQGAWWTAAMHAAADGLVLVEPSGEIVDCNPAFVELVRDRWPAGVVLAAATLRGRYLRPLLALQGEELAPLVVHLGGPAAVQERFAATLPWSDRWLDVTCTPLQLATGALGVSISMRDASERVRSDRALRELEIGNAARGRLLAAMSHTLRTRLDAIIGYSELLLDDAEARGDEALIADLRRIETSGAHLLELLTKFADVVRPEPRRRG